MENSECASCPISQFKLECKYIYIYIYIFTYHIRYENEWKRLTAPYHLIDEVRLDIFDPQSAMWMTVLENPAQEWQ